MFWKQLFFSEISFGNDIKQADLYYHSGEFSKSVSLYLDLINRDTNKKADLYVMCADSYIAANDYNSAIDLLKTALKNVSDKEMIQNKLGQIQPSENPQTLKLTNEFKLSFEEHIVEYMVIFALTIAVCPIFIEIFKKKTKKPLSSFTNNPVLTNKNDFPFVESNPINKHTDSVLKYKKATTPLSINAKVPKRKPRKMSAEELEVYIAKCNKYVEDKDYKEKAYNPANNSEILNQANQQLSVNDVLAIIDNMSSDGLKFEKFTANLLLKNGFSKTEVTSSSNDYGVDVIATNELGVKYAIQCKCYSQKLNNDSVQEVVAGQKIYNCQVAVVFTNNYFTDNAIKIAKANNVFLWDRKHLIRLINNTINDISSILPE